MKLGSLSLEQDLLASILFLPRTTLGLVDERRGLTVLQRLGRGTTRSLFLSLDEHAFLAYFHLYRSRLAGSVGLLDFGGLLAG